MAHDRYLRVVAHVLDERSASARDDEVDVLEDSHDEDNRHTSQVTRHLVHRQELSNIVARRHEGYG